MPRSEIFMAILLLGVVFMIVRNTSSLLSLKKLKEEAIVYHRDTRRWPRIAKIICLVLAAGVFGFLVYYLTIVNLINLADVFFGWLAAIAVLVFFGTVPYDQQDWAITEKGIFVYNTGDLIPWGQIITCGVMPSKKGRMSRITLQIKKEQGEIFKARYQTLGIENEEEAKKISDLIREFIHALDRKKIFIRNKEEHETDIRKRKWF
ncbi:MAG: hypothetical protein IJL53_02490 [Firmicutes bacterium]|nr:hypothetical protein [Bacillota bacterium]